MKILLATLGLVSGAFCTFSDNLVEKYSIKVLNQGNVGTQPKVGDEVFMHYDGRLKDGTKFDSSYDRGQPLPLRIGRGQVIQCWDQVGVNMRVGQKVEVVCPSKTAYGDRAIGPIPANSDLIFIIERTK